MDLIGLDLTIARENLPRICLAEDPFFQKLNDQGIHSPYVSTGHYPPNPAPYGCKLKLEEERCNAQDRYAFVGLLKTEGVKGVSVGNISEWWLRGCAVAAGRLMV